MRKIFEGVSGNSPRLNRFDLSYTNNFSAQIGYLYPVQCDEVVPGDVFKMSGFIHAEVQPLVAPVMSDLQVFVHTFFVPFRLLYGVNEDGDNIWELFITAGKDGTYDLPLPSWSPEWTEISFSSHKIWDYIGNPVSCAVEDVPIDPEDPDSKTKKQFTWSPIVPKGVPVSIAPKFAYNFIYNNYYRDENLIEEIDLESENLQKVSFKKDYFTSALEEQQRGIAPALEVNLSGNLPVNFSGFTDNLSNLVAGDSSSGVITSNSGEFLFGTQSFTSPTTIGGRSAGNVQGTVDASGIVASTFDIAQFRMAAAMQRVMELSMRAGYRYTEFLSAEFGVSPTDARLDRPEYIGGFIAPVNIGTSIQNSGTDSDTADRQSTPQGNKVGIGQVDAVQKIGNYRVLEHGLIMTMLSIRPKPIYQQGVNRQWLHKDRWTYYLPELAYLSEQAIYNAELYVQGVSGVDGDDDIFGYQGHWNHMRTKQNIITGAMREQFDYWTFGRKFGSLPHLNKDFIEIDHIDFNRAFAVQDEDEFIISYSSIIDAFRPLPSFSTPGLADHVYG